MDVPDHQLSCVMPSACAPESGHCRNRQCFRPPLLFPESFDRPHWTSPCPPIVRGEDSRMRRNCTSVAFLSVRLAHPPVRTRRLSWKVRTHLQKFHRISCSSFSSLMSRRLGGRTPTPMLTPVAG